MKSCRRLHRYDVLIPLVLPRIAECRATDLWPHFSVSGEGRIRCSDGGAGAEPEPEASPQAAAAAGRREEGSQISARPADQAPCRAAVRSPIQPQRLPNTLAALPPRC
eukprot:2867833-Rhodomonas_salina.1